MYLHACLLTMAMPAQVTGKCGSVLVRLIPAPRGAGIVAARTPKKVLQMAGIDDVYTAATGSTKTLGNFVKVQRQPAWRNGGSFVHSGRRISDLLGAQVLLRLPGCCELFHIHGCSVCLAGKVADLGRMT